MASYIANFMNDNDLDRVDIDKEYLILNRTGVSNLQV